MASNPDQFLAALVGTTGLGGQAVEQQQNSDLAQQQVRQQLQHNAAMFPIAEQENALKVAALRATAAKEAQFNIDAENFSKDPTPTEMLRMAALYPEHFSAIKGGWDAKDEASRQSHLVIFSDLYHALQRGRTDLAVKTLERVRDAERAASTAPDAKDDVAPPEDFDELISAVNSGDPETIKLVQAHALANIAAATGTKQFAQTFKVVGDPRDYTLGPGAERHSGLDDSVVARAPYAPRTITTHPGTDVYEYQPGTSGEGVSGDILSAMVPITLGAERGGTLTAPRTSPKGAKGPMQVLDGTNSNPGYGVRPAQDDSQAERARVGRDYLGAMYRRYGNPAQAWAAYNAGPDAVDNAIQQGGERWLAQLPAETRAYVNRNVARLRAAQKAQEASTVRKIATGGPRPAYRMLTAQEVTDRGLDPTVHWQVSPDNRVSAVAQPRAADHAPRTPDNVYAPILAKVAKGEPLTAAETQALTYYRRRRGGGAGVASAGTQYREGQTATGPGGQKVIFKGGKWVPLK